MVSIQMLQKSVIASTTTVIISLTTNQLPDATTWYRDADNDGFGNLNDPLLSCTQPDGYITDMSDCDDDDNDTYPDAPEYCNGENNDCDDDIDEDTMDALTVYPDLDGDGYGDQIQRCPCVPLRMDTL